MLFVFLCAIIFNAALFSVTAQQESSYSEVDEIMQSQVLKTPSRPATPYTQKSCREFGSEIALNLCKDACKGERIEPIALSNNTDTLLFLDRLACRGACYLSTLSNFPTNKNSQINTCQGVGYNNCIQPRNETVRLQRTSLNICSTSFIDKDPDNNIASLQSSVIENAGRRDEKDGPRYELEVNAARLTGDVRDTRIAHVEILPESEPLPRQNASLNRLGTIRTPNSNDDDSGRKGIIRGVKQKGKKISSRSPK